MRTSFCPITGVSTPILIPSYDPDVSLSNIVRELREIGLERIVIVDDGSVSEAQIVFTSLDRIDGVDVIHHEINRGKGAAIKIMLVARNCQEMSCV